MKSARVFDHFEEMSFSALAQAGGRAVALGGEVAEEEGIRPEQHGPGSKLLFALQIICNNIPCG